MNLYHLSYIFLIIALFGCRNDKKDILISPTSEYPLSLINWDIPLSDRDYTPHYEVIDLDEAFGISLPKDSTEWAGKRGEILCHVSSDTERAVWLDVKTDMDITVAINGEEVRRCDVEDQNFYPFTLQHGDNSISIDVPLDNEVPRMEAWFCDSAEVVRRLVREQCGKAIYPVIDGDTLLAVFTKPYWNVIPAPSVLTFIDANGDTAEAITVQPGDSIVSTPNIKPEHAYRCQWAFCGDSTEQFVMVGDPDTINQSYHTKLESAHIDDRARIEAEEILWRLDFLLSHSSREDDWWWEFKLPVLAYRLEQLLSQNTTSPEGLNLVTYSSPIDGERQRYIAVAPFQIPDNEKLPTVLILRPFIENYHPFFGSPQMARQWSINKLQALCDQYGFIALMPEARMALNELVNPVTDQELMAALHDAANRLPIDTARLFLQANCSGGFRALQLAVLHPDLFKGIGLYAPMYQTAHPSPQEKEMHSRLSSLKGMPILVVGDPKDGHSPVATYRQLVDDAHSLGIPLTLRLRSYAGMDYNVFLSGPETFQFYDEILRRN